MAKELKLFKGQTVSLYRVQKDLGYGSKTLYRYANGERNVKNMPARMICDLACYFKIEANKLYDMMVEYKRER